MASSKEQIAEGLTQIEHIITIEIVAMFVHFRLCSATRAARI